MNGHTNGKTGSGLLLFALFGLALWLFGNLYEAVVIAPNLLADPLSKIKSWREFFTLTNPIYFYIPIAPLAALTTFFAYFRTPKQSVLLKRHLGIAALILLFVLVLSAFMIIRINHPLFFGDIRLLREQVYALSLRWNVLNIIRIILLSVTVYHIFKACP
jgi:hypothetical protein